MQNELFARIDGVSINDRKIIREIHELIFDIIKKEKNDIKAIEKIRSVCSSKLPDISKEAKEKLGYSDNGINLSFETLVSPWFRHVIIEVNPEQYLSKVRCPVLAINGEKDLNVPPKDHLTAIEKALKKGGNKNYTVKELPGLNHSFQTCKTGRIEEVAQIDETISPNVLDMITVWISDTINL